GQVKSEIEVLPSEPLSIRIQNTKGSEVELMIENPHQTQRRQTVSNQETPKKETLQICGP
ncbi:MAG: hypothetical protein VXV73_03220, partial [Actinomycetota bacterium]|nr:hypothetical protein [Actinomycetota bacterium]